jgi:sugar phosphate isomerase/epimerase
MKESLHSFMKVGIVHPMAFPDLPVVDTLRKIAEDEFFGAVEIGPVYPEIEADVIWILQTSRLIAGFCGQVVLRNENLDLNSLDKELRQKTIARMKTTVDECYSLGIHKMAMLSGPDPGTDKRAEARKALIDSLIQVCSYARSKGDMGIAFEVFDREIDKKCFVGPTKEAAQIAAEVRKTCPNFGLMIDLSHVPLLYETPEQAIKAAGAYLSHVHVGNCVLKDKNHIAYGDKHPRFGLDVGVNDVEQVRQFLKALMDVGYIGAGKQNVVAFEVKPMPGESPELVIANAKRTLLEAWARL